MTARLRGHLRANLVGYIALFIALSGSAYAVTKVGSDDIRRNAVVSKHIRNAGVTGRDVKNSSLRSPDVKDRGLRMKDVAGLEALAAKVSELDAQLNGPNGLVGQIQALQAKSGVGGLDPTTIDSRLDSLCAQADAVNQEFNDLGTALGAVPVIGSLGGVNLPDYNPAGCQG